MCGNSQYVRSRRPSGRTCTSALCPASAERMAPSFPIVCCADVFRSLLPKRRAAPLEQAFDCIRAFKQGAIQNRRAFSEATGKGRRNSYQPLATVGWPYRSSYNTLRNSLQSLCHVLSFFFVPPSARQAAGALTENLPNVLKGGPQRADLSLDTPSSRGTKSRLFSRHLPVVRWVLRSISASAATERLAARGDA